MTFSSMPHFVFQLARFVFHVSVPRDGPRAAEAGSSSCIASSSSTSVAVFSRPPGRLFSRTYPCLRASLFLWTKLRPKLPLRNLRSLGLAVAIHLRIQAFDGFPRFDQLVQSYCSLKSFNSPPADLWPAAISSSRGVRRYAVQHFYSAESLLLSTVFSDGPYTIEQ